MYSLDMKREYFLNRDRSCNLVKKILNREKSNELNLKLEEFLKSNNVNCPSLRGSGQFAKHLKRRREYKWKIKLLGVI